MLRNLARMTSATAGTGTLTLGSAVDGFLSFADAGVVNGEAVEYSIRDGVNSEVGLGTYTASGTTLSRDTVYNSTDSGNKISCSGTQEVFITPSSRLLNCIDPYGLHHRLSGSNAFDDEFSTDTSADYTAVTPAGTATWTIANHSANVVFTNQAASDAACWLKAITLSDGQWLETSVRMQNPLGQNYTFVGLVVSNGTAVSSNAYCLGCLMTNVTGQLITRVDSGTITNLSTSALSATMSVATISGSLRLRLRRTNSTTYYWQMSVENGGVYYNFNGGTSDPGFTPTHAGLWVSTFGGAHVGMASFDYLRQMS